MITLNSTSQRARPSGVTTLEAEDCAIRQQGFASAFGCMKPKRLGIRVAIVTPLASAGTTGRRQAVVSCLLSRFIWLADRIASLPRFLCAAVCLLGINVAAAGAPDPGSGPYDAYYGNYRLADGHLIGIDRFIDDEGNPVVLFSDYKSGVVRRLFPASDTEFQMGPGFQVQSPVELRARFVRQSTGAVKGVSLQWVGGTTSFAERVPLAMRDVSIGNGSVRLAGTLLIPPGRGPHPGIVLLHGSGPLTRYSFGPYPHFFTSLGLAVLIFDKRGTGASTGTRFDASTGIFTPPPAAYYPDDLASDALAVLHFLQAQKEVNASKVGLWGSSEGGMLATQVAARDQTVAFAINSSGFMGPLWEPVLYQAAATLEGAHADDMNEARTFTGLWMQVARTGEGYELFLKAREKIRSENKPWLLSYWSDQYASLEQMRWNWDHILSFNSLPALSRVSCPVLGVFGAKDALTQAPETARAMQAALSTSRNRDFTVKVFPNAGHSLAEVPSGARMAPGVFETLSTWLRSRVATTTPNAKSIDPRGAGVSSARR